MQLANDNLTPDSHNHFECLRLIQDLHDLLRCAEKRGAIIVDAGKDVEYAYDWKYWADECASVLAGKI
jgi:hypothetical protein